MMRVLTCRVGKGALALPLHTESLARALPTSDRAVCFDAIGGQRAREPFICVEGPARAFAHPTKQVN
jgi:hypothetical protein